MSCGCHGDDDGCYRWGMTRAEQAAMAAEQAAQVAAAAAVAAVQRCNPCGGFPPGLGWPPGGPGCGPFPGYPGWPGGGCRDPFGFPL